MFYQYYKQANEHTRIRGYIWYSVAREIIAKWALQYAMPRESVAGIIAALSQRMRWDKNLEYAEACLQGKKPRGLKLSVQKAMRILHGEHADAVLRGPKITAFYRALIGDNDAVVLDTWMMKAANVVWLTTKQYRELADKLRADAKRAKMPPAQFQAIVWCAIRGRV